MFSRLFIFFSYVWLLLGNQSGRRSAVLCVFVVWFGLAVPAVSRTSAWLLAFAPLLHHLVPSHLFESSKTTQWANTSYVQNIGVITLKKTFLFRIIQGNWSFFFFFFWYVGSVCSATLPKNVGVFLAHAKYASVLQSVSVQFELFSCSQRVKLVCWLKCFVSVLQHKNFIGLIIVVAV